MKNFDPLFLSCFGNGASIYSYFLSFTVSKKGNGVSYTKQATGAIN